MKKGTKGNSKKLRNKVVVGAMACLMAVSMAGCGQEEEEEEKSFGERVADEILPEDHEEVKSQIEDELISELHEAFHGDDEEAGTSLW